MCSFSRIGGKMRLQDFGRLLARTRNSAASQIRVCATRGPVTRASDPLLWQRPWYGSKLVRDTGQDTPVHSKQQKTRRSSHLACAARCGTATRGWACSNSITALMLMVEVMIVALSLLTLYLILSLLL